jgi:hypothetical protein
MFNVHDSYVGCAGFAKKIFIASKRNEAKRDPLRMRFSYSRETKNCFASFHFKFFAFDRSEISTVYFASFRFQKFFVSLPIFSFRFKAKRNKRFFASKRNEINVVSLLFTRFIFVSFSLHFIFVSLQMRKQAKNTFFASKRKKFRFWFASFRFEEKMMAVFASFFRFVSFALRFRFPHFTLMRNKRKWRCVLLVYHQFLLFLIHKKYSFERLNITS